MNDPKKGDGSDATSPDTAPSVPRSGSGADTALQAMLRKRQMRAGAEPQPAQPDGRKPRKK